MKKILFLIMTCDNEIISKDLDVLLPVYLKVLKKNKLDNIEIYTYDSGNEYSINYKTHHITVPMDLKDSISATYEKTHKCFKYIYDKFDFDYVYRTNTSTFCNIVLMNEFVQNYVTSDEFIYGGELYLKNSQLGNYLYIRGNSIIFSKKILKLFIDTYDIQYDKIDYYNIHADDDLFGYIYYKYTKDYINKLKYYRQEWLCCDPRKQVFSNTDFSLEHLRKYIAIQFKQYLNRGIEPILAKYLCDLFNGYKYDKNDLSNYSENRNLMVFYSTTDEQYHMINLKTKNTYKIGLLPIAPNL